MRSSVLIAVTCAAFLGKVAQACQPSSAQLLAGLAGCVPCEPEASATAHSAASTQPPVAAAGGLVAEVDIEGFAFDPSTFIIPLNAAVNWTNRDFVPHTSTSSDVPPLWDSGALGFEQSFQHTFTSIGAFAYECTIHFGMNGSLSVRAPGDATNDRAVNIDDFAVLAGHFNQPGGYDDGNFNLDGLVDIGDFAILAGNFNQVFSTDLSRPSAVPEPAAVMLLALLGVVRRRANA